MGVVEPNAALMPHGPDGPGGGHFFDGLATADHLNSFAHDLKAGSELMDPQTANSQSVPDAHQNLPPMSMCRL